MDKQTEFYAHMCECNCFESEISVTELYDLQDSNIHLHVFKICVYTGNYDTITIILPERTGLKRQPYDKIVQVFSPSDGARGNASYYRE